MNNAIRTVIAIVSLAFITVATARADALEDGMTAHKAKDYVKAVELWRPLADQLNAEEIREAKSRARAWKPVPPGPVKADAKPETKPDPKPNAKSPDGK